MVVLRGLAQRTFLASFSKVIVQLRNRVRLFERMNLSIWLVELAKVVDRLN